MAITDSCAAGREMPRTKNQSKYIHSYTRRDSPTDRPTFENYNWKDKIVLYSSVKLTRVTNNKGNDTMFLIRNTALSISCITTKTRHRLSPLISSNRTKSSTTEHAYSTRTHSIEPDQRRSKTTVNRISTARLTIRKRKRGLLTNRP